MTDNYTESKFKVDDGIQTGIFKASGDLYPRRPVYWTGASLKVHAGVNDPSRYAGLCMSSFAEGDVVTVFHQGTYVVYITGATGYAGDPIVPTGIGVAAAYRVFPYNVQCASSVTFGYIWGSGQRVVGNVLQNCVEGDTALVYLFS